jgi:hypothetical protein
MDTIHDGFTPAMIEFLFQTVFGVGMIFFRFIMRYKIGQFITIPKYGYYNVQHLSSYVIG